MFGEFLKRLTQPDPAPLPSGDARLALTALLVAGPTPSRAQPLSHIGEPPEAVGATVTLSGLVLPLSGMQPANGPMRRLSIDEAVTLAGMAEDALSAAKFLKSEAEITKLTVVGICSGGNVGIGILDRLPECDSLFLLSVYPFGDADSFSREAKRSAAMMKEYWKKLWIKDTWIKLFRGDVHVGIIARILLKPLKKVRKNTQQNEPDENEDKAQHPLDNLLISSPRLTMIYGDADPEYGLSTEYYKAFAKTNGYPIDLQTIAGANHNFYSVQWKQHITDELLRFIKET